MYKFISLLLLILIANPVLAEGLDSQHKAWNVFSINQEGSKICYITSSPIKEGGNWSNRSEPYVLITYRGKGLSEISVSSGYPYKKGSNVEVVVDNKDKHQFFTSNETPKLAWAKDSEADKYTIKSFIKGTRLTVKGISPKDTWSKDTYSLYGFTKGYKRMQSLCEELTIPANAMAPTDAK